MLHNHYIIIITHYNLTEGEGERERERERGREIRVLIIGWVRERGSSHRGEGERGGMKKREGD